MDIFNYHPVTKEYLGAGKADPNPMEEGGWIFPAFSTTTAPPVPPLGHTLAWAGSGWLTVEDHRGEKWWPTNNEFNDGPFVIVDFIGDPAEHAVTVDDVEYHLTNVEPPARPTPPLPPVVVSPAQIRIALTRMGLRAAVEAYVAASPDQDVKDMWQFATQFERDNLMIVGAAEALGKTPQEIDALFELAKSI